jgi:hypothetical protein
MKVKAKTGLDVGCAEMECKKKFITIGLPQ